ncbi:MAG: OmpH family outer membrane protein [Bacteroidales bacterium]
MKKIFLASLFLVSAVCFSTAQAQSPKLGHINSAELMRAMPETDSAEIQIQKYGHELENNIKTMQTELEKKYMEFQNNANQMSDLIKQTKQKELQDMQVRMEEFGKQADEDYKSKQQALLEPIIDKAKKAIQAVAKENKFTYVFDTSGGVLIYTEDSDNLMALVKKKLGLK